MDLHILNHLKAAGNWQARIRDLSVSPEDER
jgi:hypothetical protein